MKHKARGSTVLIVLLMLAGLGIMLYPKASDLYFRWQAKQEIAQYNKVAEGTGVDYSPYWEAAEAYNRELAAQNGIAADDKENPMLDVSEYLNPLGNGMMGYVDVPKIKVHLPIYQGTEEKALQAGAGYWLGTSLPTGGPDTHCVLTAHNGLVKAKMFTDLDKLEEGDTFSLSILDRVMTYEVDQILVTEPDELAPLRIAPGQDYVTLYTCTPYGVNTHRLLVRGHRVETPDVPQTPAEPTQDGEKTGGFSILLVLLGLAAVAAICFGFTIYMAGRTHGKREMSRREFRKRRREDKGR